MSHRHRHHPGLLRRAARVERRRIMLARVDAILKRQFRDEIADMLFSPSPLMARLGAA